MVKIPFKQMKSTRTINDIIWANRMQRIYNQSRIYMKLLIHDNNFRSRVHETMTTKEKRKQRLIFPNHYNYRSRARSFTSPVILPWTYYASLLRFLFHVSGDYNSVVWAHNRFNYFSESREKKRGSPPCFEWEMLECDCELLSCVMRFFSFFFP